VTKIKDVIEYLEIIAPSHYQESYDNAGLLVGNQETEITGILICLDSTEAIIEEAIANNCNLVVAHQPIIFSGLRRLTGRNYVERTVIKAIKNDIAIYAIHTNLDNVYNNGVNGKIAEILGLQETEILVPKKGLDDTKIGAGIIGKLPTELSEKDFMNKVKKDMELVTLKYTHLLNKPIQKVALCGGSGGFLLEDAISNGADVFITSDIKYHEYFDADGRILVLDIGHFESEQYTITLLQEILTKKFSTFASRSTMLCTNPIKFL